MHDGVLLVLRLQELLDSMGGCICSILYLGVYSNTHNWRVPQKNKKRKQRRKQNEQNNKVEPEKQIPKQVVPAEK